VKPEKLLKSPAAVLKLLKFLAAGNLTNAPFRRQLNSIFRLGNMNRKFSWSIFFTLISIVFSPIAVQANQLVDWKYNNERHVIGLTTKAGVTPTVFLLSSPNRLVVDLPSVAKKGATIRAKYGGAVREIRIAEIDGSTRAVIELAPGYGVSSRNIKVASDSPRKWYVRLQSIENGIPPSPSETRESIRVPSEGTVSPGAPTSTAPASRPVIRTIPSKGQIFAANLPFGDDLTPLRAQLKSLMAQYRFLSPGMFFMDVETGDYVDIDGDRIFPAASTIKLPILVAFFEAVDAGRIRLDETLVVKRSLIASGSGSLQYSPGAKLSALATATKMIVISDNTATNMIVSRLGGLGAVNKRFQEWGLANTYMQNYLGDFKGTNKTSSIDLVKASALIAKRQIISESSRSKALDILNATANRKLLKAGLGKGANMAHKTGDIGFVIGDAGIVEMPSGKLYLAGIFVRRPYDDLRARTFVQKVSRITYNYFVNRVAR
jgi:beta-lactamase class A